MIFDGLLQDLRYAARGLQRNPSFSIVAALTIALGIGATTSIFSVVYAVLLRPLPVPEPEGLVSVHTQREDRSLTASISLPDYLDYAAADAFSGVAAHHLSDITLSAGGEAQIGLGLDVSGNYFDVLGLRPAIGRFFDASEARDRDAPRVVVISHALWQRSYGGVVEAVGATVRVNGEPLTIIGVAPGGFHGTMIGAHVDAWLPLGLYATLNPGRDPYRRANMQWLQMFGRLRGGVELQQAEVSIATIGSRLAAAHEYFEGEEPSGARVEPFSSIPPMFRAGVAGFMVLLLTTSLLVLLIAAVNVAGMLLARATVRKREVAVRLAIGAGRPRLVRQLLTESVLLAVVGGSAGVLLAYWAVDLLERIRPPFAASFRIEFGVEPLVLGFAVGISLLTGVLFGLAPAFQSTGLRVSAALREAAAAGGTRNRLRSTLVGAQVAISVVLLIATGLFVRTLREAMRTDFGLDATNVIGVELDLRLNGYDEVRGRALYETLEERVRAFPGVESAALAQAIPLGFSWDQTRISVAGHEPPPGTAGFEVGYNIVTPGYFETVRMPLIAGRDFTPADRSNRAKVLVVNETFAQRFWPDGSAVGQIVRSGGEDYEIIGVAPAGVYEEYGEEPRLYAYRPFGQSYAASMWLHVRTRGGDFGPVLAGVRRELRALDPNVPPISVQPIEDVLGASLFAQRLAAGLVGSFGVLGLVLAGVGLFGALSYSVAQRTPEMGVRAALGARRWDLIVLILRQGLVIVAAGISVGLVSAAGVTRLLGDLLYRVSPTDPVTFIVVPLVLTVSALGAALLPARRAALVDPVRAIRSE
ncbi:MAG: ABC transporter permease [Longimicrobiales bacterium]